MVVQEVNANIRWLFQKTSVFGKKTIDQYLRYN